MRGGWADTFFGGLKGKKKRTATFSPFFFWEGGGPLRKDTPQVSLAVGKSDMQHARSVPRRVASATTSCSAAAWPLGIGSEVQGEGGAADVENQGFPLVPIDLGVSVDLSVF